MGRMKEIVTDIEEMLYDGMMPQEIAKILDIPVRWVYEVEDNLCGTNQPDDNMSDAEADADALASAGWGTDEDYGMDAYDSQYEGDF